MTALVQGHLLALDRGHFAKYIFFFPSLSPSLSLSLSLSLRNGSIKTEIHEHFYDFFLQS